MAGTPASDAATTIDATVALERMISNIMTLGGKIDAFLPHGATLLLALTVIAVAWTGIKAVLEGDGVNKIILEMATIGLMYGMASWVMTGYVPPEGGGKEIRTIDAINAGFDNLAKVMLPDNINTDPAKHVSEVLAQTIGTAMNIFIPPKKVTDGTKPDVPDSIGNITAP